MTENYDERFNSAIDELIEEEGQVIAREVREFVTQSHGWFTTTQMYSQLRYTTKNDRKAALMALLRLYEEGVIERNPRTFGRYRKIIRECTPMNWKAAPMIPIDLRLPMGLSDLVHIYPGNVIIVAGAPDAGKTSLLLNIVKLNQQDFEVHYFNSEMGESEFHKRLSLFEGMKDEDWKFKSWERSDFFEDIIQPNAINIIDFLEIVDNAFLVATHISRIHEKLDKGVAIIAIQKSPPFKGKDGKWHTPDLGRGASFSLEKARLYISLDFGIMKVVKAKNWKTLVNPNGKICHFKIVQGAQWIQDGEWRMG